MDEEEAAVLVIDILERHGSESRLVWLAELHRVSGIDKGLLRNVMNKLKKSREIREMRGAGGRIFFCLARHYVRCRDAESRPGGGMLRSKKTPRRAGPPTRTRKAKRQKGGRAGPARRRRP